VNKNQDFLERMKFDIYKKQNKPKLIVEAGKTFDKTIDSQRSRSEMSKLFDRLYYNAVERKEERSAQRDKSIELSTRKAMSEDSRRSSKSRSKTPSRKIGKKEAGEIY